MPAVGTIARHGRQPVAGVIAGARCEQANPYRPITSARLPLDEPSTLRHFYGNPEQRRLA